MCLQSRGGEQSLESRTDMGMSHKPLALSSGTLHSDGPPRKTALPEVMKGPLAGNTRVVGGKCRRLAGSSRNIKFEAQTKGR